jgi:DNA-directed RNA polymerase subunit RPC12/RpoP
MFCPKCGKEFEKDIYVCSECGVSLVPELLPDSTNESLELAEFEEILFTPSSGDMAVIKSLLDSQGIVYYFRGEFFTSVYPLAQPARLMVRTDQAGEVEEILGSLNITCSVR